MTEIPLTGGDHEVEAEGETVGEAKWTATRELERRFPGLDKSNVEFVVLSEGERGLLGVGFVPARVVARVVALPEALPADAEQPCAPGSPPAGLAREFLEQVRDALGLDATVSIREADEGIEASFRGRDLGLAIGKHGQTVDAIQYLATAVVSRQLGERVSVTVDAAGYRERRRTALEALADRAAARSSESGEAVALDPMSAAERKVVHVFLKERPGITTSSEGAEPARYVVVHPSG